MKSREDIYKITSVILMLDQFIKILVSKYIDLGNGINIIPNFFSIIYIKNTGAAFSIFKDNTTLLIVVSIIMIIVLDRFIKAEKNLTNLNVFAFGLIMGGILGNFGDRLFLGYVRVFLKFNIFGYNFPIFNIADICIVIGVFLLIICMIRGDDKDGSSSRDRRKSKTR